MKASDNKLTSNEENKVKWGGIINEFLWLCAGVNREIIRQCPTDYAKYAGTGGTILFTALMAMLSGGYAISTVFTNVGLIIWIIFGILWGLLIFNLDRLIVNTMYSDGKPTISWKEFMSGLPRIIMAIFLGFVISTPLELKIYEDEIIIQIEKDKEAERISHISEEQHRLDSLRSRREEILSAPLPNIPTLGSIKIKHEKLSEKLDRLYTESSNYRNRIAQLNAKITKLITLNSQEESKGKYIGQIAETKNQKDEYQKKLNNVNIQINDVTAKLMADNAEFSKILKDIQAQKDKDIESLNREIDDLYKRINNKRDDSFEKALNEKYGGFQARMKSFNEMKQKEASTYWSALFITLLFIIIECAPTFFKMMMSEGSYEDMLRAERAKLYAKAQEIISIANDETNTVLSISIQENKDKTEAQIKANKILMEKLSNVQAELLERAIDKWREEELKKIEANPSAYIYSNTKS